MVPLTGMAVEKCVLDNIVKYIYEEEVKYILTDVIIIEVYVLQQRNFE